jgi:ABC-type transport system involved in multi-copper enzyme maturation permease subunit
MTFLPIVERELRVASRRHSTYSMRLLIALGAIVIGFFLYLAHLRMPVQQVAPRLFIGMSALAMFFCLSAGRRSTADCLSAEKREGTLGLLFLTDLRGFDVVFGKLAANSLTGFYCLLGIFPVLAIPLLMGGVTNGEFWRMVAVLLDTFLFALAVGLLASVLSRDARKAYGANFLILLLLIGSPPAVAGAVAYFSPSHLFVPELLYSCPVYACYLAFERMYPWQVARFWSSIAIIHLLTWLCLWLACRLAPRCWQDEARANKKRSVRERFRDWKRDWMFGKGEKRRAFRKRLLDVNAFYWLASRMRLKPMAVWSFVLLIVGWWVVVRSQMDMKSFDGTLVFTTIALLNCVLKCWIGLEAGQRLAEDQKSGALELLLSTPLTVRDILRGQLLALRRQFLAPALGILLIECVLLSGAAQVPSNSKLLVPFGVLAIVVLLMDVAALVCVAIAAALVSKSPNQATVRAFWRLLILPWLVCIVIMVFANLLTVGRGPGPGENFFLYLWFWLGMLVDIAFGLPAWWQLRMRFRELALQRVTSATR